MMNNIVCSVDLIGFLIGYVCLMGLMDFFFVLVMINMKNKEKEEMLEVIRFLEVIF